MSWKGKTGHVSTCLTQEEKDLVYQKIGISGLAVHEYMNRCLTEKEINIVKDLGSFTEELKKIGHQLDYLIFLAEKNEIKIPEIRECSENLEAFWEELKKYLESI